VDSASLWAKHLKEGLCIGWPVVGVNPKGQRTLRINVGSIRATCEPPGGTFAPIGSFVPNASLTNFHVGAIPPALLSVKAGADAVRAKADAVAAAAAAAVNTGAVINEVCGENVSFAPPAWSLEEPAMPGGNNVESSGVTTSRPSALRRKK